MSNWKNVERQIATRYLRGVRIPVLGKQDRDIDDGYGLWCDVKSRLSVSKTYYSLMKYALAFNRPGYTYAGLVYMPVYDFTLKSVWKCQPVSKAPVIASQWLAHIAESCPAERLPCVVMHIPGSDYKNSVIVFDGARYASHDWSLYMRELAAHG